MGFLSGIKHTISHNAGSVAGAIGGMGIGQLGGALYDQYGRMTRGSPAPNYGAARRARAGAYNAEQIGLEHQNEADRQQRESALSSLDQAYASPERMAGMEKLYGANLNSQIQGLQSGYNTASQKSGLAAARRGRLGSSTDTETQAKLGNNFQSDVMNAESQSYGGLDALRTNDENAHQALRRAILAGDPQTAAALQSQAQGYSDQSQQLLQQQQRDAEARQRQQQQQQGNYDLAGNLMINAGQGYTNYNNYRYGY